MNDKQAARRVVLAALSTVYEPLGLGSPFLLKGRLIIQSLCKNNLIWGEPIDDNTAQEWFKWRNNMMMMMDGKNIAWCLNPENFGNFVNYNLPHFPDARESGYGQSSYIWLLSDSGHVHCILLIGKSRVVPFRLVSIPMLKLTAATLSVNISNMMENEMDIHVDNEIFWTDRKVILEYIDSGVRQFKLFVASRVQQIKGHTSPKWWYYIESSSNPADDAYLGLDSKKKD